MDSLIAFLAFGAVLITILFGLRFIFDYRIADGAIEIVLFHFLVAYRIPISNIEQIGMQDGGFYLWYLNPFVFRLQNRVFTRPVLIRRRGALMRKVTITPADPANFIEQVKAIQAS